MFDKCIIESWKSQAQSGKPFPPETVLAMIHHIEAQDKIMDDMERELEHRDYMDEIEEKRELKNA